MAIDDQGLVHTDEEDEEEYVEDGEYEDDEELDDEGDTAETQRLPGLLYACKPHSRMPPHIHDHTTMPASVAAAAAFRHGCLTAVLQTNMLLVIVCFPDRSSHPRRTTRPVAANVGSGAACRGGRRGGAGCGAR